MPPLARWRRAGRIAWQVGLLTGLSWLGSALALRYQWPVPGNVVGLLLLLGLLFTGVVRLEWVEEGADFLVGHLLLFFIPAAVGIVQYTGLLATHGVGLLLIIGASTALVMASTGLAADRLARRRGREEADSPGGS